VVWQPFYGSDNGYTFLLEAMRGTFLQGAHEAKEDGSLQSGDQPMQSRPKES